MARLQQRVGLEGRAGFFHGGRCRGRSAAASSKPRGASSAAKLALLAGIAAGEHDAAVRAFIAVRPGPYGSGGRSSGAASASRCSSNSCAVPRVASVEQRVEFVAPHRMPLGRALHLDEAAAAVHHDVHVGLGGGVLDVVEVEHRRARRRCRPRSRPPGRAAGSRCPSRPPAARRHRRARHRLPVIDAVRVPPSACSTSQSSVTVRSPSALRSSAARRLRPIRRWISCVRPDCLPLAASRGAARVRGARQHAVFGGDPALALAAQERRHAFLDARGAQHARLAELDEHRAFGVAREAAREAHRAQLRRARGRPGGCVAALTGGAARRRRCCRAGAAAAHRELGDRVQRVGSGTPE